MITGGIKLELVECPGFSQPPKGIYREVVRQITTDLQLKFQASDREGKVRLTVENEPAYFNSEAIRAAKVFMRDVSNYQHDGTKNLQFVYRPSKIVAKNQTEVHPSKGSGGWVHLVSLVELMNGSDGSGFRFRFGSWAILGLKKSTSASTESEEALAWFFLSIALQSKPKSQDSWSSIQRKTSERGPLVLSKDNIVDASMGDDMLCPIYYLSQNCYIAARYFLDNSISSAVT